MTLSRRTIVLSAASGALLAALAPRARGAEPIRDKVLNLIVAGSPAGMHSRYARMLAPYLQKHSGAREVRVTNMQGGGGLRAAGHVWRLKGDSLTVGFGNASTLILAPIAGSPGAQFETEKFNYLGRVTSEPRFLYVGGKSPLRSMADVLKLGRPFVYPSQGTDEDFYTMAVLADALGFKLKAVTGYEGNADTGLAVIKGDGDGHITGYGQSLGAVKSGDKRPILAIVSQRHADHPDVPTALELASAEKKPLVKAVTEILEAQRTFYAAPAMDAATTAALRAAVTAMLADPALIEELRKNSMDLAPMTGAAQQALIAEVQKAARPMGTILKDALKALQ